MAVNAQMAAFCLEYMVDSNGQGAAIRAGYARKSAKVRAWKLLQRDDVKAELARLREKAESSRIATHKECCEKLTEIIRTTLSVGLNNRGGLSVAGIKRLARTGALQEVLIDAGKEKIKLRDPRGAIETLARLRGYNAPDEHKVDAENTITYRFVRAKPKVKKDAENDSQEERV